MAKLILNGSTSGSVTLESPAVSGTTTLTLPNTSGTVITDASTTGISASALSTGTVPTARLASGTASASNYLRGDQTWSTISAGASTLKVVTDTTDIAVTANAPTQTLVGSSFSVSIPTSGLIRIASFSGRIVKGAGTTNISQTWGIRIGSTNYWFSLANNNGTLGYTPATISSSGTNGDFDQFYGGFNIYPYNYMWQNIIDITAQSVPTGTQTVQLIVAKAAYTGNPWTDSWTVKGATTTTRVGLEFVSAS
jgi:hypothetical protein